MYSCEPGYEVPAGDQLQVLLSPGSWPTAWPSPSPTTITIHQGTLSLPTLSPGQDVRPGTEVVDPNPKLGPPMKIEVRREPKFVRKLDIGLSNNVKTIKTRSERTLNERS